MSTSKKDGKITTGSTDLAEAEEKKQILSIYGSIAAALVFGVIGVSALLFSKAAPANFTQLNVGQSLTAGQALLASAQGPSYKMVLQGDGNLVIYNSAGKATWNTHTSGTGSRNRLTLQSDSNLVLYNSAGKALWNSKTANLFSNTSYKITSVVLKYTGDLDLNDGSGHTIWNMRQGVVYYATGLYMKQTLKAGQTLASSNSSPAYRLTMQTDGNLVVYNAAGKATWNAHTAHTGSRNQLVLQSDGNLVLYNSGGKALWNSGTPNLNIARNASYNISKLVLQTNGDLVLANSQTPVWNMRNGVVYYANSTLQTGDTLNAGQTLASSAYKPAYRLVLQHDGNLVIYSSAGQAVWSTHTANTGSHNRLVMQGDNNLVLYSSGGQALWSAGVAYSQNNGPRQSLHILNTGQLILYSYWGVGIWSNWQ